MINQLYTFMASLRTFWQKHQTILFVSSLGILLAIAIFSLYQVLTATFETPPDASSSIQTFDKKTVDKIKNLHVSTDSSSGSLSFPEPRPNPFNE